MVENSQTHSQLFDARGLAGLDIILDRTPYLDGSAVVSAANGSYVEEESLLGSGPNDRHFLVLVDESDRATVRFERHQRPAAKPGFDGAALGRAADRGYGFKVATTVGGADPPPPCADADSTAVLTSAR